MKLIKSKLLMSLLKKGGSNNKYKQLLIKLINNMIRKSYKDFLKKKGGDNNILKYSFLGNNFTKLEDGKYFFDNTNNSAYDNNNYKFNEIPRTEDGYVDRLADSKIFNTIYLDYNKRYDVSTPLKPER